MRGLFVAGTDTDVGKTYVSCLIAEDLRRKGIKVGVCKPAASGCFVEGSQVVSGDALALWNAAGRPGDLERVCPQRFIAPLAPHRAAEAEGRKIDRPALLAAVRAWKDQCDVLIVEGVGGLLAPLDDGPYYVADLARECGFPLIVVSRDALGTINHTLLTLEVARARGLSVAGVVLNQPAVRGDQSTGSNREEIAQRAGAPLLATVYHAAERFGHDVDWSALAGESTTL
ncbi:MAG TPA: dethiobiotin synthase [Pirellulales bacterium]